MSTSEQDADDALAALLREIGKVITQLSEEVGLESKAIAAEHPGLHTLDTRGRPLLLPRLVLMGTLCEHPSARSKPSRARVSEWERRYLALDAVTPNATKARGPDMHESARSIVSITFEAVVQRLPHDD